MLNFKKTKLNFELEFEIGEWNKIEIVYHQNGQIWMKYSL